MVSNGLSVGGLIVLILPYTDVCVALYTQRFPRVCGKNFTGDSGGIRTHDLLLTSADVLTSRPPSLPRSLGVIPGCRAVYGFMTSYWRPPNKDVDKIGRPPI